MQMPLGICSEAAVQITLSKLVGGSLHSINSTQ